MKTLTVKEVFYYYYYYALEVYAGHMDLVGIDASLKSVFV